MHIATKTNETNTENKSFKKARFRCNGKVVASILILNLLSCGRNRYVTALQLSSIYRLSMLVLYYCQQI